MLIVCGLYDPCKTTFSTVALINPEFINKIKLINKIMWDSWSEICRIEMFQHIYGLKKYGRLV